MAAVNKKQKIKTKKKSKKKVKSTKARHSKAKTPVKKKVKIKSNAGRRTILTPEIQKDLISVIAAGNYYVTACNYIGLAESTFYSWLKRGEEEILRILDLEESAGKPQEPDEDEVIYVEFLDAIKKADAGAEIEALLKVKSAYGDSWQAAMTFLERRHSSRWRKKERLELTGDDGDAIQVHVYLPDNGRDNGNDDDDNGEGK